MEYYSNSGNRIMIGHFPGQTKLQNKSLIKELSKRKFTKPNNIGFICPVTKDKVNDASLINQLKLNGYNFYNSLEKRSIAWTPEQKVIHVLNTLKLCKEEYSLILDTNDVVILTDLDDIINRFETYNKKIIYNSTIWMHPHIIVDDVENRNQYGQYCYLNAGCAIGKTDDLTEFYNDVYEILRKDSRPVPSEQYYVRKVFNTRQDEVFFDWDCRIFQCWHKQDYRYEKDEKTGVEKCFLL